MLLVYVSASIGVSVCTHNKAFHQPLAGDLACQQRRDGANGRFSAGQAAYHKKDSRCQYHPYVATPNRHTMRGAAAAGEGYLVQKIPRIKRARPS